MRPRDPASRGGDFRKGICGRIPRASWPGDEWEIFQTDEVAAWMEDLRRTDPQAAEKVEAVVDVLSEHGPTLGRPLVDTLTASKLAT